MQIFRLNAGTLIELALPRTGAGELSRFVGHVKMRGVVYEVVCFVEWENGRMIRFGIPRNASKPCECPDKARWKQELTEPVWCRSCGQPIPSARLKAFPGTEYCVDCKKRIGDEPKMTRISPSACVVNGEFGSPDASPVPMRHSARLG